jgi:hypothetical protein
MEFVIVQNDHLKEILERLTLLEKYLQDIKSESIKPIYDTKGLSQLLIVSSRTIQKWRDEGDIGFSQKNGVILYTAEDIIEFLKKNHKYAFKK